MSVVKGKGDKPKVEVKGIETGKDSNDDGDKDRAESYRTLTYDVFIQESIILLDKGEFDWKFWKNIEYAGLDPEKIFDSLKEAALTSGRSPIQFMKDIATILTFYVRRGTNISGASKRTEEKAMKKIKALKKIYEIGDRLGPENKSSVTVGRIAAVFPEFVAAHFWIGTARMVVPHSVEDYPNLPRTFAFPGSPALMTAAEWERMKGDYLKYMVAFSRVVNSKDKKFSEKTDETIMKDQETFAMAAQSSSFNERKRTSKRAAFNKYAVALLNTYVKESGKKPGELIDPAFTKGFTA